MQARLSDTAILLFTHDADSEVNYKCFSPKSNRKINKQIAESLIRSAERTIAKTNIPYFVITTRYQSGNTFGERLTNAIQTVFEKGFEKVIVTGNDSPNLTSENLIDTKELLYTNEIVIGPTIKGGTYLIGLTKNKFNKESFESLAWQSNQLTQELINYAANFSKNYYISEPLHEINTSEDLRQYIDRFSIHSKLSRLLALLIYRYSFESIYFPHKSQKEIIRYLFGITAPPELIS
ncbi:MAG: DUF2064 domain-containing protein [Bacteroidia bacterium]